MACRLSGRTAVRVLVAGPIAGLLALLPTLPVPEIAIVEVVHGAPAAAVDVIADELEITFAEGMNFSLVARSTRPIESVVLRFSIDDPDIVDRRIPIVETGTEVVALHEETLVRGQIPPTAEITWWWSLLDDQGNVTETERSTTRYLDESIAWRTVEDEDIRVWFEGGADEETAALETASSAREAIDFLSNVTGRRPDELIEIVAYNEQEDLRRALAARGDVYETRLRTLGARVAPRVVVLDVGGGGRDLAAVIFHELSHVVLGLHMEEPWADLPAWLDEGFAMYAEGELGGEELSALEQAFEDDDLMSVRSLSSFPGDAERVTQAYGQSRDFVAFLVEDHDPGLFRELLDTLAQGDVAVDDALGAVYGYDRLSMYQAYRADRGLEPAVIPTDDAGLSGAEPRAVGDGTGEGAQDPEEAADAIEPEDVEGRFRPSALLLGGLGLGLVLSLGLGLAFLAVIGMRSRSRANDDRRSVALQPDRRLPDIDLPTETDPVPAPSEIDKAEPHV